MPVSSSHRFSVDTGPGAANAGPKRRHCATANWLSQFEHALAERDEILLKALFHPDSHWRDVLAVTWRIITINGGNTIASELLKPEYLRPAGFKLAPGRTAPRYVARAGIDSFEAIFIFETAEGRGNGVLKSVAWGRNREHNGIQRSPERNRTAAEMSFSTAC